MVYIRSKYISPGIHLLIWISLLVIPIFIFRNYPVSTGFPNYFFLFTNIYHIGLFYLNAYVLYPVLFTRKTWWLYFPVLGVIMALSYYAKLYLLKWAFPWFVLTSFNNRILFFPPFAFLVASFIFRFISDRTRLEKLEK